VGRVSLVKRLAWVFGGHALGLPPGERDEAAREAAALPCVKAARRDVPAEIGARAASADRGPDAGELAFIEPATLNIEIVAVWRLGDLLRPDLVGIAGIDLYLETGG
jgi:hypothetical protein